MNTIKAFFQIIRAFFPILKKTVGETHSSPLIVPLMHHQTYTCILKIIVSTSKKNFNNSIKIAVESVLSSAIRTVLRMSTLTNITKILKQSLKIKKNKPHNFIIT